MSISCTQAPLNLAKVRHGYYWAYSRYGCRCGPCRLARARKRRRWKLHVRARRPDYQAWVARAADYSQDIVV